MIKSPQQLKRPTSVSEYEFQIRLRAAAAPPDSPLPFAALGLPAPQALGGTEPREPDAPPAPPPMAALAYGRLAFGPRPGDIEAFNALGGTDQQRLAAWLDSQLDPASIDDSAAESRLAESDLVTLERPMAQLWAELVFPGPPAPSSWQVEVQPLYETIYATVLRGIHSKRQVFELMVEFWHHHFSVFAREFPTYSIWPRSDATIREHALGNFRALLEEIAKSTAMLFFLDNYTNAAGDPNENYARELMELHTLGIDAYMGSIQPGDVPQENGLPIGYTETDVVEAAKCLTGWTFRGFSNEPAIGNTGEFLYYDQWHDHDAKTIVGLELPANQPPMKDGRDLLDHLVRHPATGRFIAKKLCCRLVGDNPPPELVELAAATFTATTTAPDQIAQVVRVIATSRAFATTWGEKVKQPFEIALAMFRGANGDLPFRWTLPHPETEVTFGFMYTLDITGQQLFGWITPEGYPDLKTSWSSTGPRVMCWRLVNWISVYGCNFAAETPLTELSPREIVQYWCHRLLGRPADPTDEIKLISFMSRGADPDTDLPWPGSPELRERIRALGALICMTPSFLWR